MKDGGVNCDRSSIFNQMKSRIARLSTNHVQPALSIFPAVSIAKTFHICHSLTDFILAFISTVLMVKDISHRMMKMDLI